MVEDVSPRLNGSDVIMHAFTSLDSVREHPDDLSEVFYTFNKVQMLEIAQGLLNFLEHWSCSIEATLDLSEVVMSGEAINESSDEIRNGIKWWKVDMSCSVDWCVFVHMSS